MNSDNNIEIDYNFRAGFFTRKANTLNHVDKLANVHTSLFDDIDIKQLALDKEAVNI